MMTEIHSDIDDFNTLLETLYSSAPKDPALEKLQANAWERFCELGLPTRKNEVFRYVKLRQLYSQEYKNASSTDLEKNDVAPYIFAECQESALVFINGHFMPKLSRLKALPEKMVVMGLGEAMRTYGALLTNHMTKAIKEEKDPFAVLNLALHGEAAFLYLPPKTICAVPLQILHLVDDSNESPFLAPRLQLFASAFSEIELISKHVVLSTSKCCINQRIDISVEENAHVRYVQSNCHDSFNVWHFDALRATLKKFSSLHGVNVSNGSGVVRNDFHVTLTGEGGEATLNGVWMLSGKREIHQHILIDHQAPNCLSRQLFKGVLKDTSHSSFEGKIMVRKEAQETNAFQLNHNLLLSDGAAAESKPNLEIFADNVKASHGATIGQLEKEELFYMRSRGFSVLEAQKMLVHGFCQEVIDMIRQPTVRLQLGSQINE
ncbi:MAG: Fe-S cluster assembly protein SufD [Parachlamydiaceae bacterium]|nr:Fe-S cluster assembly protein SufD [Parachlamydiaceae bacterium]